LFRKVIRGRLFCAAVLVASLSVALPALASAAQRFGARTLKVGMQGTDVTTLQHDLTALGYTTNPSGSFTLGTKFHVKDFQRHSHIPADGVVGPQTYARLKVAMTKVEGTLDAGALVAPAGASTAAPHGTATTSSAALPADDSGGAGFVPTNTEADAPAEAATLNADGTVTAPADAPEVVQQVIAAANEIAFDPYVYGGGHNGWGAQSGYDCSGSTSYALHAAGLLNGMPLDSTQFGSYGDAGVGKWITLYAESGHVYMNIAGLWFDTADQSSSNGNDRWSSTRVSPAAGFVARHPDGW
jgi:cell wall-associated NlpC family hydrolase